MRIGGLKIAHLQFADDTIFFLKEDWNSVRGIKIILVIFEIITGLKVNFAIAIYLAKRAVRSSKITGLSS